MRSMLDSLSFRLGVLACGVTIVAGACGGGSGGGGGTGGARADGSAGAGDARTDGGTGGAGDARTDTGTGAGGAATDGGGTGGAAADAGAGGMDGAVSDAGDASDGGTGGAPLSLPWHAFWPLGMPATGSSAATGTLLDVTANHYDATYFGTTISFSNAAMNLTGVGSELVLVPARGGVPAVDVTGSYSVSAWVSLANVAGFRTVVAGEGVNVASFFLQKRADTGAWAYTVLASDATNAVGCIAPGPPTDGGPAQNPVLPIANTQYHLVATREATTGLHILYVNGVESGRNTCAAGWADTGILGIGHGVFAAARGDNVQGSIAEVGVINRALTAAEVVDLFARGRSGTVPQDAGVDATTEAGPTDAADAAAPDAPAD